MCRKGDVQAVLTEDIDALAFGAPVLVRGITTMEPNVIRLDEVLASLSLDGATFLDMCLLSGSDFTPKPAGFGPATSLKALKKYGSLLDMCLRRNEAFAKWSESEWSNFAAAIALAWHKFADNWVAGDEGTPTIQHREWPVFH